MYIWNLKGLVQALKEGSLSNKSKRLYKVIGIFLLALELLTYPVLLVTQPFNILDIIVMIIYLVINLVGIYMAYTINQRGDGKGFLFRYISLYVPLTLRFFVFVLVVSIVEYTIILFIDPSLSLDETNWFDLIISIGTDIYFNILMVKYIKIINR
ncbi:hypothetical protein ACIQZI_19985 [Peribacillus sp. NPDC096379]|uniref:hypothetical protein n=1 Tax=Peribacillus sp. NPDC096379 TaxID=3364393 RepID=UPI00382F08E6